MQKRQHSSARIRLEISLKSIQQNFLRIQRTVQPAKVMAVLKADAYGLGAVPIAEALADAGASRFGVAGLREAITLKKRFSQPIHVLSGLLEGEVAECVRRKIICPVSDYRIAQWLSREAVRQRTKALVHIKVDTGMGRLGIPHFEARETIQRILKLPSLETEGIFSHFANANNPRHAKTREQIGIFRGLLRELESDGIRFPLAHLANSDGINNFPEARFDMVRTGINLYGVFDLLGFRAYKLSPSLSLNSVLLSRRRLPAGFTIGYGCTHTLFRDTWVGTVPAGYADGVPLAASNSASVLIRGKECPIIGRVSMDYLAVDLTPCAKATVGDEVVLVGKSGKRQLTIEDWARVKQTHPYDIICSLGPRVERVYLPSASTR
ncbi:MAG TPA: alanine racemase [Fibrobacteres bacterium]|jgi:alanine racemase|nr:alanine racemase [Fibrobacterota bacterium]